MFVLMHGEVRADSKPESFVCGDPLRELARYLHHCETKTLDCAVIDRNVSCVKKGMFK
jgi:hypothetical protein